MVSRAELERIARKHDTAMSRAMIRALGVEPWSRYNPAVTAELLEAGRRAEREKYKGLAWCFRNFVNPVDARHARHHG